MATLFSKISDYGMSILSAIPDMFVLYDKDLGFLDVVNPKPELLDDASRTSSGETLVNLFFRNAMQSNAASFRETLLNGKPSKFDFSIANKGWGYHYEVNLSRLGADRILACVHSLSEVASERFESEYLRCFFSEVLDHIAIPISLKSLETGRYIFWNKQAEVFGCTAEEIIGKTEEQFMTCEQAFAVQQISRRLAEGEKQHQNIERYTLSDGKEHIFMISRSVFVYGKEHLILSNALDISDFTTTKSLLLKMQEELADKNKELSLAMSVAKLIPWECDLQEKTFFCDYGDYHHESASAPDAQGKYRVKVDEYINRIHPDYRGHAIQMIQDLLDGKQDEFQETYLIHWFNDREYEWVQVQSCIYNRDANGHPQRIIGSAQCVTAQKEMEMTLRQAKEDLARKNMWLSSVMKIARVLPWECDLATQIFFCDYDNYHFDGLTSPDAEGRYMLPIEVYFSRIHPDYRDRAIQKFAEMLSGQTEEFHETYPIHWYNDEDYEWVEAQSGITKIHTDGTPLRIVGSAQVVTGQKRMEESLREAKEQAEQSNVLKSAFLANMSHEIRTPLNAIVGFSDLLAQTESTEEKQEYLAIIKNSNDLLLQLIGDILDLSKIEAGTLEFSFENYNLNKLMEELARTARMKVDNQAIEVAWIQRLPECTIYTDRNRLLQVFHNFINNAAKFTQQGYIHFGYRQLRDGKWYFYVTDTGCGIAANHVNDIFDRFIKLNRMAKGTGLGLTISKSIVEYLGGEIGVDSVEGEGSTFWFTLPAESVTVSVTETDKSRPDNQMEGRTDCGPLTILVAEDDPNNYRLIEILLKKHYTLLHAWDGREAVALYREQRPDLILMDIKMPEMDGYEATAVIRELSTDVPIIAVTAFAYPEDEKRILASGFDAYITKPVSRKLLLEKIAELCRK
ncbi:response regulator [uncultured Bacteroides sp.]|uniref:response regulator n=1 Tax=uncultured Bacteroides sp. TaxID=162156 RepID=UPI0025E7E440|nr:response regulator [uncultured Bacteroides sp.]